MPATLREVLRSNTFEEQRQIINTLGLDFRDYVDGTGFSSVVRLTDGTASSPALFFDTDVDLGLFKSFGFPLCNVDLTNEARPD